MNIETERLILRPIIESDAEDMNTRIRNWRKLLGKRLYD